jgi:hypothetical protein
MAPGWGRPGHCTRLIRVGRQGGEPSSVIDQRLFVRGTVDIDAAARRGRTTRRAVEALLVERQRIGLVEELGDPGVAGVQDVDLPTAVAERRDVVGDEFQRRLGYRARAGRCGTSWARGRSRYPRT